MIYFDNAATGGYKPSSVTDAVNNVTRYTCANAGRSGHRLAITAGNNVFNARIALCDFFNNQSLERVVFTKNCTEALNMAIFGTLKKGGHIVSTVTEHNSVLRVLNYLQQKGDITYDLATINENNFIDTNCILNLIKENTYAIILNMVSNVTGNAIDIKAISDAIKGKNIIIICDGAQAAGHKQIDMQKLGIDVLCVAGHKGMYAIQGSGALLFNRNIEIAPIILGGTGSESNNLNQPTMYPDRLESGTLNYPAIVSLLEGTVYIKRNLESYSRSVSKLTDELISGLKKITGIEIFSCKNPYGIVSFKHNTMQSEEIATILSDKYDIAVRGGLHCAPLIHKALNTLDGGLVRASLSAQNTLKETLTFISAIKEITN